MAYGQDANLVLRGHEAVERNISGSAVGDHQLAKVPFDPLAHQGMARHGVNGVADGRAGSGGNVRIVFGQELERSLEVRERVL